MPPELCERFFDGGCPHLPERFPAHLPAEPFVRPATGTDALEGTTVTVGGVQDDWLAGELDRWSAETGIRIVFTDPDLHELDDVRDESADIVTLPTVGLLPELVAEQRAMDLSAYLDEDRIRAEYPPYILSLGSVDADGTWPAPDGRLYGALPGISIKSLVWYRPDEFERAGYTVPETLEELDALTDRIRADGRTPWCIGLESGDADGWPATDWAEDLMLATGGPEKYDAWSFHEIPFTDPSVRTAFERFGEVVFTPGSVPGGADGVIATHFDLAPLDLYRQPLGCWLYHFPSFISTLPADTATAPLASFPFPAAEGRDPGMTGGGNIMVALADRPEVRALMRFMMSSAFGPAWFRSGEAFSSNLSFDADLYPRAVRDQATAVREALEADAFRSTRPTSCRPRSGIGCSSRP
jgi:alpha-glucoside transport system substrate-binding protein